MGFCGGDEGQMSVPEDFKSSLYLAPYTSKKRGVIMMKSCKLIPRMMKLCKLILDGFAQREDT